MIVGMSSIRYNGYQFNDRSTYGVVEQYVYDDSERTVKAVRFTLNVKTIITGNAGASYTPGTEDATTFAGLNVHNARQLLSKPAGILDIKHDGLGPWWEINGYSLKDISWGPKPRFLRWDPVGHTNAAEVEWECEFEIAICDGTRPPALSGIAQFSYSVSFSIDQKGYTTRRISGVVEIALTRLTQMSNWLTDSVDRWKDQITFGKPTNFERQSEWSINPDKRTATFIIVDSEIQSPNAWPPGVVGIQATHRVNRNRNSLARVSQTLSATIELSPIEPKVRTWLIFRDLFLLRIAYLRALGATGAAIFIESIDVAEEIYANKASFQIVFYYLDPSNMVDMFSGTGLFQPLLQGPNPWLAWASSLQGITPHQGTGGDRAAAGLMHEWGNERIIDLCNQTPFGFTPGKSPGSFPQNPLQPGSPGQQQPPPPWQDGSVLSNTKPSPLSSWLQFSVTIEVKDDPWVSTSVQLAPNATMHQPFNPQRPDTGMPVESEQIKRFIEDKAGFQSIIVRGYAERIGYPVPKPGGRIFIGGQAYTPVGKGAFGMKFDGDYFGVPKYSASWAQEYRLLTFPNDNDPKEGQEGVE